MNTTSCPDDTERACEQYYQIDVDSWTTKQQALVGLSGPYFYAPAIAANDRGDAVFAFNGSGPNNHIRMYLTGHYHTDPPNTVGTIYRILAGGGCYETRDGQNSVSSHSDATVDPINDNVFWLHSAVTFGEDAKCLRNDWATEVAAVQFVGGGSAARNAATKSGKGNGEKPSAVHLSHFGK